MSTSTRLRSLLFFAVLWTGATGALIPPVLNGAAADPMSPQVYRQYAMSHEGDSSRGRLLFVDEQKLACVKCHSIDGKGLKAGPDLFTAGDTFSRRDLIDAVLTPSASIAVGYSTTLVETKSGEEYQGVLKQVTASWIELMAGDGDRVRVATTDIHEQRGSVLSLMPEGLQAGVTRQEFTDLIEYLVSLKEPAHALTGHRGMPASIPPLAPPMTLRPFLNEPLRVSIPEGVGNVQTGLVWFGQVPGRPRTFLAADQAGMIWAIEKNGNTNSRSVFADLTTEVFSGRGPNGLLGLAFHPRFRENRKYYLKHQIFEQGKIVTVLVERKAAPGASMDSGNPSRQLLKIVAIAEHHNGGCIQFGPDGFLYFGMGDSAPNFDPQGYGQDLGLLFGKMLRIDVDRRDPPLAYGIPSDNPFVGRPGVRPEIWAYGFREPWRFSFDTLTGDLWVADLGQERGDEVDIARRGENYGWNVYEGFELFSNQYRKPDAAYVPPLFSARRKDGSSMVGGFVYRGDKHSSFNGVYIFGDYQSKHIWGLTQTNGTLKTIRKLATAPQPITAFATDDHGSVYIVGYHGMIYQLDLSSSKFDDSGPRSPDHRLMSAH